MFSKKKDERSYFSDCCYRCDYPSPEFLKEAESSGEIIYSFLVLPKFISVEELKTKPWLMLSIMKNYSDRLGLWPSVSHIVHFVDQGADIPFYIEEFKRQINDRMDSLIRRVKNVAMSGIVTGKKNEH